VRARVPARLDVALALAQAQAAAGDLRASRDTLRDALQLAPQALPLRAALAAAEIRIGDARAATQIARALQVDFPRQPVGYAVEAQILIGQRRYDEAAASYERAFAIAPTWEVLVQWLTALQLAGADARVESLVRDWLANEPEHVPARMFLALILQSSGRGDEALQEYERVLVIAPNDVPALNNAAWLAHERGIPGALARAERARELAPDTPPVLDTLGWILVGEGRGEEGARYLEQAAAAAPGAADIQYHYAAALARLGNSRAARDLLRVLLGKNEPFATRADAEALLRSL
jgi:tetratricopeptide (TPR) repeat protein